MHTSHYSRLEKPTIPLATKDYHAYITRGINHYAYAQQTQVNSQEETNKDEKERKWVHRAKKKKR